MSDITTGYAFSSGEKNVTHTKLNNALNNAVINPTFFTGKSNSAAPGTGYVVALYDPSGAAWYKATLDNLIFEHAELIQNRTALTTLQGVDAVLVDDDSDTGDPHKRVTIANFFKNADADLISEQTVLATPETTDTVLLFDVDADALKEVTRANLFYQWWTILNLDDSSITALSGANAVQEADTLILADSSDSDNTKKVTIGGLIKFLTAGSNPVIDADQFVIYDSTAPGGRSILGSAVKTYAQTGCIMQVVQTAKTDVFTSSTTGAWTDITTFSLSITPRDANSKILLNVAMNVVCNNNNVHFRLMRDATPIGVGDAGGAGSEQATFGVHSRNDNQAVQVAACEYLDSPATASAITYKVQYYLESGDWFLNEMDTAGTDLARFISTITAKEVAA